MNNTEKDLKMAKQIAYEVAALGGRTFYVGGYVRDKLLGKENKDIDIEIHGVEPEKLQNLLKKLGTIDERKVGDNFGIFALKGYDIDIALPRSEKVTGNGGHKDFIINTDPFIGYEKAAKRRDFTMNALMQDVITEQILDFYNGYEDLKTGVIRHVDDKTFGDDPLRVLRAAQFASRFNFEVAYETINLSKTMDLSKLSHERIAGELNKALLKSDSPSIFFDVLKDMGQLDVWFPEVKQLIGVNQEPTHHPEGDVYTHTMMVLDQAAKCRNEVSNPEYFMISALCHDFGKPFVTQYNESKQKWQAIGHDAEGVKPTRDFINRIYNNNDIEKYVSNMTKLHMKPLLLLKAESKHRAFMEMFDESVSPKDLIILSRCDNNGRCLNRDYGEKEERLNTLFEEYKQLMKEPHVTGKDLLEAGFRPGPEFSEILSFAHKNRLAGVKKEDSLRYILGTYRHNGINKEKVLSQFNKPQNKKKNAEIIER